MAHKTFISYKYSEARNVRDRIINALGADATYYQGETSDSPDLTDTSTENIKRVLKDMMFDTSVTIVILSPNMRASNWIGWEIEYSLKSITRKNRTSHINGVVAVIKKVNGSYDWFKYSTGTGVQYHMEKIQTIIEKNHFNSNPPIMNGEGWDWLNGSYIAFIEEDDFLDNPRRYIDNAYDKSENDAEDYDIVKQV